VREVYLVGVGATEFGSFGQSACADDGLARAAAEAALADANLTPADISAASIGTGRWGPGGDTLPELGPAFDGLPLIARPSAWAGRALQLGWQAVAGGEHDVVLCLGIDRLAVGAARPRPLREYARAVRQYMSTTGATVDHLAQVAVKNHLRGAENPRALRAGPVDAGDVMESEVVAWPLRRLMVAAPAGGAAAVVFSSQDPRRPARRAAPHVRSSVLLAGSDVVGASARAARLAYQSAGLGPEDVDVAEVDDLTSAGEVMAYESLQFVPEGHGHELVESGFTAIDGVLPVNSSGGLLSHGDAFGASSIAQVCELVWQLRREAGPCQVPKPRVGLALSGGYGRGGIPLVSLMIVSSG